MANPQHLMPEGRKRLARMCESYPPHRHHEEDCFDRYVKEGLLHKEVSFEPFDSPQQLKDGSVIEERQPYLRGGAQESLTRQDVTDKFVLNARHGGWSKAQSDGALKLIAGLYRDKIDLSSLRG